MKRMQVQFDEATYEALRRKSYDERRSISALIRDLVPKSVGPASRRSRPRRLAEFPFIGAGRSKQGRLSPVSERHDDALATAFAKTRRK
jgi:hypothetical protein